MDPVGWPEGNGKDLNMDHFHIVNSGPCAINEVGPNLYISGNDEKDDARFSLAISRNLAIQSACEANSL